MCIPGSPYLCVCCLLVTNVGLLGMGRPLGSGALRVGGLGLGSASGAGRVGELLMGWVGGVGLWRMLSQNADGARRGCYRNSAKKITGSVGLIMWV